jgi:hypothetical protein
MAFNLAQIVRIGSKGLVDPVFILTDRPRIIHSPLTGNKSSRLAERNQITLPEGIRCSLQHL